MFGNRFFGARYFGDRYWGGGSDAAAVDAPVTTAGRSYGTQYRAKTISRELREKERAARKAARKLRVKVVAALEAEAWFNNPEAAKAALSAVKTEITEAIVPQFIEEGLGESIRAAALLRLMTLAAQYAEMEDDDDLLLLAA